MSKIWERYRAAVFRNCTHPDSDKDTIAYWKNYLFASAVLYLIPLSIIAVVPGMYMAYISELYLLFFVDFAAIGSFFAIAFLPGISIQIRKLIFCLAIYGVSLALLYTLGSFGPGLLYLLALSIIVVLILDELYGIINVYLNIVICALFGILIEFNVGGSAFTIEYSVLQCFGVSVNLIFLSAVSAFLIPKLFNGLETAFLMRREVDNELQDSLKLLEIKNRELEDFAYTASHDLKEPLRMVRSFSELLKKRQEKNLDEKSLEYIHFIVDGAKRMNQLIEDLLEFSRVGRMYKDVQKVNINDILQDIKTQLQQNPLLIQGEIIYTEMPVIEAVPLSIKILFQNLISNGLKFHPKEKIPRVELIYDEHPDKWVFSVKDNGIGIDKIYHESIFQLFNRLHTSEEYSGTGLGLAICKKIVEQHGGEIWVESEPGKGSTFHFTISKGLSENKIDISDSGSI